MKKAIFIILFALPLFLMVTISVVGRVIIQKVPVPVEAIIFEGEDGETDTIYVGKGQEMSFCATVLPELATNKKVFYSIVGNNNYIEYDEEAKTLTGLNYGTVEMVARTEDKNLRTTVTICVSDKYVADVSLNFESLTMNIGEVKTLIPIITPATADDRRVEWKSSDPAKVTVRADGRINALAATDQPVVITVTTVDGEFTAECHVTVLDTAPAIAFYRNGAPLKDTEIIMVNSSEVNLLDHLRLYGIAATSLEGITFTVTSGDAVIEDGILTINSHQKSNIMVTATKDGVTCTAIFRLL